MSNARKERQRAQRKERRQLRGALIRHSLDNKGEVTVGEYRNLNTSFSNFAINETLQEIKDNEIETDRLAVLKKAVDLGRKITDFKKLKNPVGKITVLSNGFEMSK